MILRTIKEPTFNRRKSREKISKKPANAYISNATGAAKTNENRLVAFFPSTSDERALRNRSKPGRNIELGVLRELRAGPMSFFDTAIR
ncbi:hypothetical protein GWI33_002489 [Rhynchophorus ferrugineus]|uniref:Uncharacterized protein n=1 Tax=Rhynchophorus ferrugineus TaxID=354439 RepID=A0A834J337_RHYFE|nr:hypothetical protein GWI33_002489 [Rhynchophorus ferrugineus]